MTRRHARALPPTVAHDPAAASAASAPRDPTALLGRCRRPAFTARLRLAHGAAARAAARHWRGGWAGRAARPGLGRV